ncbi:MAG: hypothetical protein U0074_08900 [Kouleothrix sp.]
MNPPTVGCQIPDTGTSGARSMMIRGGRRQTVACHALVRCWRITPQHGWLQAWDTGYAPHMLAETMHSVPSGCTVMTPLRSRA